MTGADGTINAVEFRHVDIIFGNEPARALDLLDAGADRERILSETGHVLGAAGCTMSVAAGEICVLMGLSGSGKSTLLRAVNGLNKVTRGEVLVRDGDNRVDVAACDSATLRRLRMNCVAMVFQQFALLPWRTVEENVGFGLELRGLSARERHKVVADKLSMVGLTQWGGKFAHQLSGGMQQRVGLARAFATDADILLMDEPFSALDPLIRTRLQDELLALQTSLHKTILFVSHDLDEALKIGTHIAIMEGGHIVQFGTPEQIVLAPASAYVADFVAHVNPLNVLRGRSLMTPSAELRRADNLVDLDVEGEHRLRVDSDDRPVDASARGRTIPLWHYDSNDGAHEPSAPPGAMASASPEVLMKTAIELRHATGNPIVLVDSDRFVGVIGDREIYRGMLRQSGVAPPER